MENKLLSNYLNYLNKNELLDEQGRVARWAKFQVSPFASRTAFKSAAKETARISLKWTLLFTPLMWAGWRAATALYSQAYKKCGTFSFGPGRKLCVIREKMKALREKERILKQARSQCNTKSSDPAACGKAMDIHINKIRMKIDNLQTQYETLTGMALKESSNLQEAVPFLFLILGGILVDKALFLAWRSLRATYDSELRKCGVYGNKEEHKVCLYEAKLKVLLRKYALLKRVRGECVNQKDPGKCIDKVDKKLREMEPKVRRMQDNVLVVRKELADKRAMKAGAG